jgi:predicted glycoside hydrolase/deacetylase ChbG (UPF0249 family)
VERRLIITADDLGIGPATSRGIVEVAARDRVTASTLLVNSPYAEHGLRLWRSAGQPCELGLHFCLTNEEPISPSGRVASLVDQSGRFHSPAGLLGRLLSRQIDYDHLRTELTAQYRRFCELLGHAPTVINGHHHVHALPLVREVVADLLRRGGVKPFVRRVHLSWGQVFAQPGQIVTRAMLKALCRPVPGTLGADSFAFLPTLDSPSQLDRFFRSLAKLPGQVVELCCHPGYPDETLEGRDPLTSQRVGQLHLLQSAQFVQACRQAGFELVSPSAATSPPRLRVVAAA